MATPEQVLEMSRAVNEAIPYQPYEDPILVAILEGVPMLVMDILLSNPLALNEHVGTLRGMAATAYAVGHMRGREAGKETSASVTFIVKEEDDGR